VGVPGKLHFAGTIRICGHLSCILPFLLPNVCFKGLDHTGRKSKAVFNKIYGFDHLQNPLGIGLDIAPVCGGS
jgi:hypothetical protein